MYAKSSRNTGIQEASTFFSKFRSKMVFEHTEDLQCDYRCKLIEVLQKTQNWMKNGSFIESIASFLE